MAELSVQMRARHGGSAGPGVGVGADKRRIEPAGSCGRRGSSPPELRTRTQQGQPVGPHPGIDTQRLTPVSTVPVDHPWSNAVRSNAVSARPAQFGGEGASGHAAAVGEFGRVPCGDRRRASESLARMGWSLPSHSTLCVQRPGVWADDAVLVDAEGGTPKGHAPNRAQAAAPQDPFLTTFTTCYGLCRSALRLWRNPLSVGYLLRAVSRPPQEVVPSG